MTEISTIIVLTIAAGICIPLGGLIASFEHIRPNWLKHEFRHFVVALGGGVLLGAVATVLVPEGISSMGDSIWAIPSFMLGGLAFFWFERLLGLKRREAPQLTSMLLDYLPEAIALGGLVALGSPLAPLMALLIGLQNLPEGFNTYRELEKKGGHSSKNILFSMSLLVVIGPISGLFGYYFLAGHQAVLGALMLFAAGGILYIIFQDIAPQSRLDKHWLPPLGAVLGFSIALFGEMLLTL